MSTPDFENILDKPLDDIEKPKAKPAGTYIAAVSGLPSIRDLKINGEDTQCVDVKFKLQSPFENTVDADALAEVPPVGDWAPFTQSYFHKTEGGAYALSQLLKNVFEVSGMSIRAALSEINNRQCLVTLEQKPGIDRRTNEPTIFTNISTITKL